MKKIISILVMLALSAACFAGCGTADDSTKKTEKTVMHLALNPEVEVVLDEQDRVIAVNAINEEGNLIISDPAFENVEGKTAGQVAQLFVQVSGQTGYLVSGNVSIGDNQISVSISGDAALAEKLYQQVSGQVQEYLSSEKIEASVQYAKNLTDEKLRQELAECAPYLTQEQINAMDHKALVEELAKCRLETAKMYSQQLKLAYYDAKAFALEQARMEALKAHLPALKQTAYDLLNKTYVTAVEMVETVRAQVFIEESSPYQLALAELRARKAAFLAYRSELAAMEQIPAERQARLDELEELLNEAETRLDQYAQEANRQIDEAKKTMTQIYEQLTAMLDEVNAQAWVDEISQKQTAALEEFFAEFETGYAAAEEAARKGWDAMRQPSTQNRQETA